MELAYYISTLIVERNIQATFIFVTSLSDSVLAQRLLAMETWLESMDVFNSSVSNQILPRHPRGWVAAAVQFHMVRFV